MARILSPAVIETKQELLAALRAGELQTSKYNLLKDNEKRFVELIVFGDYNAGQAIRVLDPDCKYPDHVGNKMLANKLVAETLEELSIQRDAKFMAELSSTRDQALSVLKHIMITSKDDVLRAACAKTILDKGERIIASHQKDEQVGAVRFNIQVENVTLQKDKAVVGDIIIPISDEDEAEAVKVADAKRVEAGDPPEDKSSIDRRAKAREHREKAKIDPKTGLPYTIAYAGVDSYGSTPAPDVPEDPVIQPVE